MRAFLIALCVTATMGWSERAQSTPDPATTSLIGWWRGEALCLELFANGDFELSIMGAEPKIQVLGSASVAVDRSAIKLNVKRIWRARYVSRCRKTHETGHWINAADVLGVSFAPSRSVQLTLRPIRDGQLEVCAESCATLKREKPVLLGRWRRASFENASKPELTWTKGEVVELNLDETDYLCHVWSGSGPRTYDEIHGVGKARYLGPDRFAVTLTAEADKSAHEYTARRLTNERIEVCDKARLCSTLERQFDPYLNIIDLGPSRALRSERRSAHSAPVRIPGTVLHPFPRLLIRQRERLSNFVDGADFTVDTVGLP